MFDWAEYLHLADNLLGQTNEAALRSAISRAYYATYNKALEKLLDEGQMSRSDPTEPQKHKAIWDLYRMSSERSRQQIGLDGDRLRKSRTSADYNAERQVFASDARMRVNQAKSLYQSIQRL